MMSVYVQIANICSLGREGERLKKKLYPILNYIARIHVV